MSDLHQRRFMLKELLDNKELVNGIIVTEDGGRFDVHIEIIAAASPSLRNNVRFKDDYAQIKVPIFSKDIMGHIINYIYTGQLSIRVDNVHLMINAGRFFQMPDVVKLCEDFILSCTDYENCFLIFNYGKTSKFENLEQSVKTYILNQFELAFFNSNDFLDFEMDDLVDILSNDYLNVLDEKNVFTVVMKWIEKDVDVRLQSSSSLIRCVRFGFCSLQFYENNILNHPLLSKNENFQDTMIHISELFSDLKDKDVHTQLSFDIKNPFLRPRIPREVIFLFGGWTAMSVVDTVETYDTYTNQWFMSMNTDSTSRSYHSSLWHKGYIYIIGGFDGTQSFSKVSRYDPITHTWEEKACMHEKRSYVSACSLGNFIYAMGGFDGFDRKRSCEKYDPTRNNWNVIAPMHQIRSDASADILDERIYIAGGVNGLVVLESVECYLPSTNEWLYVTNMTSPRSGAKLINYKNYLYIIGGFDGFNRLKTVQKYDAAKNQWITIPDMNTARTNFAATVCSDRMYVIGGFSTTTFTEKVEYYDDRQNDWIPVKELSFCRSALSACTIKDIPNAHEYTYHGNAPES